MVHFVIIWYNSSKEVIPLENFNNDFQKLQSSLEENIALNNAAIRKANEIENLNNIEKDNAIFQTRDALQTMIEESHKDAKYQKRINLILIIISILTLIVSIAGVVVPVFS